jgi:predicted Fe-S protein YdhL (DUF1289 family)
MKKHLIQLAERARVALRAEENVPSPCISVCRMEATTGLCAGCYRTLDELRGWSGAPDDFKRGVWRLVLQRAGLIATLNT